MASPPRRGRSPPKVESSGNKTPPASPKGKALQCTPSPSPSPPHRSRTRDARPQYRRESRHPREVIVERVIRETGSSGHWPQLTKTNYNEWALLMKLKLQARHLWDVVDTGDGEYHDDRTALEAICSAVPTEMVSTLAVKDSAKGAWEAIKTLRIGDARRRKATAQNLRTEYETITLSDGEPIEDFAHRLNRIVQRLEVLGDPEPEAKVVAKYLRVARPKYKQLIISMESFVDISTLTIKEVTDTLRAADEVDTLPPPPSPQVSGGKLLLTEEQWLDRYKQKDGDSGRGGANSGGRGKRRGKPRGRGGKGTPKGRNYSGRASQDDECRRCGKKGHWAKDCRGKLKVKEEAYATQEDKATLMFAYGTMDESGPAVELPNSTPLPLVLDAGVDDSLAPPPPTRVEIVEAKVFAAIDVPEDRDLKRWVLDTGATNHMTGFRDAFSDLDTGIVGTVRFGDGSVIRIKGRGTILFSCKNGEHRSLGNIYFIPRLTTNIISVGQLDEVGFKVLIEEGMMQVFDEERRLLAKVHRGPSRLYVLEVTIARPMCWAAYAKEDAWLWHARFGHVNFGALRKMGREELVRGMSLLDQPDQLCDACLAGKHKRTPFP
jgi:hypothetical protein